MASVTQSLKKFMLVFYVPHSGVDACKAAVFKAGAGRYPGSGQYSEACWSTTGTGQFRPGPTANPNIGAVGELEEVPEVRVEVLCVGEDVAKKAVADLKVAHPYEEVPCHVYKLEDF
ncbi:hypothetical protein EDB81DRAFT_791424 [Dactylonectria macrodidyma]|uniref:ATP phosphoribosyltransferase n=1 Tax=Dactylonectria macrodidyma TaxID=307937 RepID=A0A9P9F623_9HYPO|nr:hypothetical protein EDB81DRAFT_791424 [Dactylonectria macrodidyma]